MTGKNPGKHGVFDFSVFKLAGSGRGKLVEPQTPSNYKLVSGDCIDARTLWDLLSESGKKVGVMNVPITYPPEPVNGFLVCGHLAPGEEHEFTYPAELKNQLLEKGYRLRLDLSVLRDDDNKEPFLNDLYDLTEKQAKACLDLMESKPWDFFMMVFDGVIRIQGLFWKYIDKNHPEYREAEARKYRKEILRFYQKIDQIIGRMVDIAGEETSIIVMSDHGSGPVYKQVSLNRWLTEKGFLKLKKRTSLSPRLARIGITRCNLRKVLQALGLRKFARETVPDRIRGRFLATQRIDRDCDWSQTLAYAFGWIGKIFINLKGRERFGIVEPGKQYEELKDQIKNEIMKLSDPETGELIVERVYYSEEVYSGPHLKEAPDLIVIMKDMLYTNIIETHGEIPRSIFVKPERSGTHRPYGILIASGTGIKENKGIKNASIMDLTPTILYMMGLPIPSDMDGRAITDMFTKSFLDRNHVQVGKESTRRKTEEVVWTVEDEEKMKERLRALGYLG